jgi:ligand-binding sensor domain-containing protein/signal transduction histidine kinase
MAALVGGSAVAAAPYRVTVWTEDQGLPGRRVQALQQTRDGYLWIGTDRGLARFDGSRFTVFNDVNTPAMTSDGCTALAEDEAGVLWIGTTDGLLAYDQGGFRKIESFEGVAEPEIRALVPARGGGVWLAADWGLSRVREDNRAVWTKRDGLSHDWVYCMSQAPDGTVWVGTQLGLQTLDLETGQLSADLGGETRELKYGVLGILADSRESAWIYWQLGLSQELRRFNRGTWETHPIDGPVERSGKAAWIHRDRVGALWITAGRHGLDRFVNGDLRRFTTADGLPDNWVLAWEEDREGSLWMGTDAGGLTRWRSGLIETWGREHGLPHDNCWAVTGDRAGALWIASDGGVTRIGEGAVRSFTEADGLPRNTARALLAAADGAMWVGTGGGLCVVRGDQITGHPLPGDLGENKVRALAQTADHRIWVGTASGLFRSEENGWTHFTSREGLPHLDVRALLTDREGRLWVGTFGGGLACWAGGQREVFGAAQGLPSDAVWALHEGGDGTLWIGTVRGLGWWRRGRVGRVTAEDGLLELGVNSVIEDLEGDLWLGGEKGIYRLRRRELDELEAGRLRRLAPAAYGVADGLPAAETNGQKSQPAVWRDEEGTLWFPTVAGVVRMVPGKLRSVETAPVVVIESVVAGGAPLNGRGVLAGAGPPESVRAGGMTNEAGRSEVRIAAGQRRALEIHYSAPSFVAPELVRFRYRLDGEDAEWNEVGARREAYYTQLRPGRYLFRVQACNSHGVWSQRDATVAVVVEALVTETSGFRAISAGVALGLVTVAVRRRFRNRLRLEQLERENALARERARIAKDLHDIVGANLTAVATHLELARRSGGQTTSPATIEHARAVVEETARTMSEIIWSTDPRQDTLEATVNYLCRYAEDFLEPAGIRCWFDLPPVLPRVAMAAALRHELLLTAREALTNIVKHAGASEVRLRLTLGPGALRLEIGDNGRGGRAETGPGEGHGLANMSRRMESVGGRLMIEAPAGGGWRVKLEVPWPTVAHAPRRSA